MFYSIPVSNEQVIAHTPLGARCVSHLFFESKNDGAFLYKDVADNVTITIDGKMICRNVPILPFLTTTTHGLNRHKWQDVALEVNQNVDLSEIKISAQTNNDFNVVFVCTDKPQTEVQGFDFVEATRIKLRVPISVEKATEYAEAIAEVCSGKIAKEKAAKTALDHAEKVRDNKDEAVKEGDNKDDKALINYDTARAAHNAAMTEAGELPPAPTEWDKVIAEYKSFDTTTTEEEKADNIIYLINKVLDANILKNGEDWDTVNETINAIVQDIDDAEKLENLSVILAEYEELNPKLLTDDEKALAVLNAAKLIAGNDKEALEKLSDDLEMAEEFAALKEEFDALEPDATDWEAVVEEFHSFNDDTTDDEEPTEEEKADNIICQIESVLGDILEENESILKNGEDWDKVNETINAIVQDIDDAEKLENLSVILDEFEKLNPAKGWDAVVKNYYDAFDEESGVNKEGNLIYKIERLLVAAGYLIDKEGEEENSILDNSDGDNWYAVNEKIDELTTDENKQNVFERDTADLQNQINAIIATYKGDDEKNVTANDVIAALGTLIDEYGGYIEDIEGFSGGKKEALKSELEKYIAELRTAYNDALAANTYNGTINLRDYKEKLEFLELLGEGIDAKIDIPASELITEDNEISTGCQKLIDKIIELASVAIKGEWGVEKTIALDREPLMTFAMQFASDSLDVDRPSPLFTPDVKLNFTLSGGAEQEFAPKTDLEILQAKDYVAWRKIVHTFGQVMPRTLQFTYDYNRAYSTDGKEIELTTGNFSHYSRRYKAFPPTWDLWLFFIYKKII